MKMVIILRALGAMRRAFESEGQWWGLGVLGMLGIARGGAQLLIGSTGYSASYLSALAARSVGAVTVATLLVITSATQLVAMVCASRRLGRWPTGASFCLWLFTSVILAFETTATNGRPAVAAATHLAMAVCSGLLFLRLGAHGE